MELYCIIVTLKAQLLENTNRRQSIVGRNRPTFLYGFVKRSGYTVYSFASGCGEKLQDDVSFTLKNESLLVILARFRAAVFYFLVESRVFL